MDLGGAGDGVPMEGTLAVGDASPPVPLQEDAVPLGVTPGISAVDISVHGDGKLWKEVIKEGEAGDLCASDGMEVLVHYVGNLSDGTEFDRSNTQGPPFKFLLGDGKVIKGWDVGVAGMKRGEISKLICHPDYAYGKAATGSIPPNSTLIFAIEMVDYVPEDLSKLKNGHLLRFKRKVGKSKFITPNNGSQVEVHLEGKYQDRVVFPARTESFILGEGSEAGIPKGVEKALFKFGEGEQSILTISHKYGPPQSVYQEHNLPPDAKFQFYVELKSMDNVKEPWQMDGPEKLEIARECKRKGGEFFSKGNYRLAIHNYKRIVEYVKAEAMLEGELEEERQALLLASYLNQAISNLKMNKAVITMRNCKEALEMDPNNTKGLYRRGLAQIGINEPAQAELDFRRVLELEPDNKAAAQQLLVCERKIHENTKQEKQIYAKMFGKSPKSNAKPVQNGNGMDPK